MDVKFMVNEKYSFRLSNYARDLFIAETADDFIVSATTINPIIFSSIEKRTRKIFPSSYERRYKETI